MVENNYNVSNKVIKRKKKKSTTSSNQQISGNVNLPIVKNISNYNEGEKRLLELEKIANSTANLKSYINRQQEIRQLENEIPNQFDRSGLVRSAGGSISNTVLSPLSGVGIPPVYSMSGIEADFLVRQIHSADSSQISALTSLDNYDNALVPLTKQGFGFSSALPNINSNTPLKAMSVNVKDKMNEALQEKISLLEKQIVNLNSALERKEVELGKKDNKIKKIMTDSDSIRTECSNNLKQLQSEVTKF